MNEKFLFVTSSIGQHKDYKKDFEKAGYRDVTITDVDNDGLRLLIMKEMPSILFIDSMLYSLVTPYRVSLLHEEFPTLKIVAVSYNVYPEDLAKYFIFYGASSYIDHSEGHEVFLKGLEKIRYGNKVISENIRKILSKHYDNNKIVKHLTKMQIEVIRCMANGFKIAQIAKVLGTSKRTIDARKSEIYKLLSVHNSFGLLVAVLKLKIVTLDQLIFSGNAQGEKL